MTQITVTDLNNAKLDVDTIASIANSTATNVTDRLGGTRRTLYSLANEFPNAIDNAAAAAADAVQTGLDALATAADVVTTAASRDAALQGARPVPAELVWPGTRGARQRHLRLSHLQQEL